MILKGQRGFILLFGISLSQFCFFAYYIFLFFIFLSISLFLSIIHNFFQGYYKAIVRFANFALQKKWAKVSFRKERRTRGNERQNEAFNYL